MNCSSSSSSTLPERVRQWQAKEKAGLQQLAALAVDLAHRFPQATVVYRPHPFERMATYDTLLPPLENLHCVRTGSIDAWLLKAACRYPAELFDIDRSGHGRHRGADARMDFDPLRTPSGQSDERCPADT